MKKYIFYLLLCIALPTLTVQAQRNSIYSQYMFHGMYINPAYAGYKDALNVNLYYRSQWTSMNGGPKTFALAADMPTANRRGAFGLQVINDRIGGEKNTSTYVNYAHRLRLSESDQFLVFGIGAGFVSNSYDNNDIITEQPEPISVESTFLPDVRVGVYYHNPNFFAGISADNLVSTATFNDDISSFQPTPHIYFNVGGLIRANESIILKPSALVRTATKSELKPWTTDINLGVLFAEQFTVGATYRNSFLSGSDKPSNVTTRNSIIGLVEFATRSGFKIGYSFDYPLSSTINNLGGTHEVSLGYTLPSRQGVRVRSPRFF